VRVTIETIVDDDTAVRFLDLYRHSFAPLEGLAAARQSLTDDEFLAEMRDETVLKFIGWDRRERPAAMVVINTDLDTVPWVSPEFWRRRYPEQAARGAIFYFGALLVSPDVRGGPWAHRMLAETVRYTARHHAVAAFDCCQHNVDEVQLPRMIAEVANALSFVETERVDTQAYYAYVTHGLRDEIDLREESVEAEPRGQDRVASIPDGANP
jgi:hypothetical protein